MPVAPVLACYEVTHPLLVLEDDPEPTTIE